MDINAVESTYTQIQNSVGSNNKAGKSSAGKDEKSKVNSDAAVYEKSSDNASAGESTAKQIYSRNQTDRAAIVEQMKAEMNQRQQQLVDLVRDMISKQGSAYGKANDDIWKFLASGKFEVDAETKAQAQADIAEDGYWGVEQTSARIFDFASALAGDDEEAMRKMQKAFEKGFKQATHAWGKELPDISSKTYDAVQKKFQDYFDSKKS